MKKDSPEYEETARMLPSIPVASEARKSVLIEIAGRVADMQSHEGYKRKMQVYYTLWLDKLLLAGVDVAAVDRQGNDCLDILDTGTSLANNTADMMAKRLIDHGFPFVERKSITRLTGKIVETCLAHLAMRARQGVGHCDGQGNNVLHACAQHRSALLAGPFGGDRAGKNRRRLFDKSQNIARHDGCTPLHVLWDNARQRDFDYTNPNPKAWLATGLLIDRLGGDLHARDHAGRSVLDIIQTRMDNGLVVEPIPGVDRAIDTIHANTMAALMRDRVAKTTKAMPKPRL